jgi:hypothetical protein
MTVSATVTDVTFLRLILNEIALRAICLRQYFVRDYLVHFWVSVVSGKSCSSGLARLSYKET